MTNNNNGKDNNIMNMQTRIYAGVTVDVAKLTDLYEAVSLVDGAVIVHTAADKYGKRSRPAAPRAAGKGSQLPRQLQAERNEKQPGKLLPVGGTMSRQSAGDPRAVFTRNARGQVVIDFHATLRKVGLTIPQLMALKTKLGTLENSLKHSLNTKQAHQRKRLQQERRAA